MHSTQCKRLCPHQRGLGPPEGLAESHTEEKTAPVFSWSVYALHIYAMSI